MIKRLSFIIVLALAISSAKAEELPKVIRFGAVSSSSLRSVGGKPLSTGLIALAQHLGFFEQEFGPNGPKIEEIFFAGTGPAQNEALAQGNIDFGSYGGVPNVLGLANGIPAHIVLARRSTGAGNNYYIAVRPDSSIKTLADLRGKRITVLKGTNPYQMLVTLLESRGIGEKEVNLINLQSGEALVAFNAGAVDAVFGGLNLLILRDQGKVRIVESSRNFKLAASASGTLVTDRFAKTYQQTLTRVLKVIVKTSWWASEEANREELVRFISERSLNYEYVKEDYVGSLKERHNPLIDESTVDAFKEIARFSARHRLIRREVDERAIRDWFAPQYLEAALKELNLEHYWTDPEPISDQSLSSTQNKPGVALSQVPSALVVSPR